MGANTSHEAFGSSGVVAKPHSTGNVFNPYGRASLRKSLRRRKSKRKHKENNKESSSSMGNQVDGPSEAHLRRMDKLRKSLRDSFRKKKDGPIPEASKPHMWHSDESAVRAGTCSFYVKYMGCVEVYESRGMQVCEEALKVLRSSRRRPVRGILYVSGDGLRVVDDETKGLIVDQTIEKVSFCAPDRNHERGFSYICRDGTTRRWMCHGFIAGKDTGERLSHAVGCAFASCLERKQKRDNECGVTMTFDQTTSTFTRMGSFRQMTVTERLSDPQECKPIVDPVPVKKVDNPHAIARPHATPQLLQRQGSFRVFNHLNQSSPFKRQLSLRISDLPSNRERTRSLSFDANSLSDNKSSDNNNINNNNIPSTVAPIPESSPLMDSTVTQKADAVSAMCQQVSAGLSLLSNFPDEVSTGSSVEASPAPFGGSVNRTASPMSFIENSETTRVHGLTETATGSSSSESKSKAEEWLAQINSHSTFESGTGGIPPPRRHPHLSQLRSTSLGTAPSSLEGISPTSPQKPTPSSHFSTSFSPSSLTNGASPTTMGAHTPPTKSPSNPDPFDADWATVSSAAASHNPNNPFVQNTVTKAFQVHM